MQEYFLGDDGVYHDYNFVEKRLSKLVTGASITPYVFGISEDKKGCLEAFKRLELPYGVAVGDKQTDSGFQWAYPNTWAPHNYWAYIANKNVGLINEASEIVEKYLDTVSNVFEKTGKIFEKYDARTGDMTVFNEYGLPEMLGWTAGVFQAFYKDYLEKIK